MAQRRNRVEPPLRSVGLTPLILKAQHPSIKALLTALLLSAATLIAATPAKTKKPLLPATDYAGIVTVVSETSVSETSVSVKGEQGTRVFQIHPGTLYGSRGKGKLTDFPVGALAIVSFSKVGSVRKAENIHKPRANSKVAKALTAQQAKTHPAEKVEK